MRKRLAALALTAALAVGALTACSGFAELPADPASASIFGDTARWACDRLGLFCDKPKYGPFRP